jgi:8-oxo-dGTP diphosphatase
MPRRNERGEIRAAGGVVFRVDGDVLHVLMIHRPAFHDWSLPKGKVKKGETDAQAALREVEEETGLRCELGCELGVMHYRDRMARAKVVRYWAMTPRAGRFVPSTEVDSFVWLDLATAAMRATRSGERDFLARLLATTRVEEGLVQASSPVTVHEEEQA